MSSASRPSEARVKPTRSANRTETSRRSAAGRRRRAAGSELRRCASADPHSPQNFFAGAFAVPQAGQATRERAPHSPQNFRPAWFSALQAGQAMLVTRAVSHVETGRGNPRRATLGA